MLEAMARILKHIDSETSCAVDAIFLVALLRWLYHSAMDRLGNAAIRRADMRLCIEE
jgi:hypothetical protein